LLDAQDVMHSKVISELKKGEKKSHWIWFVFPQKNGLGHSKIAETFAIQLDGKYNRRNIL